MNRRNHKEEEPEWFTGGPTSQHDTIELRGFDKPESEPEELTEKEEKPVQNEVAEGLYEVWDYFNGLGEAVYVYMCTNS